VTHATPPRHPPQVAFAFAPGREAFLDSVAGGTFNERAAADMESFVREFTSLLAEIHTFLVSRAWGWGGLWGGVGWGGGVGVAWGGGVVVVVAWCGVVMWVVLWMVEQRLESGGDACAAV